MFQFLETFLRQAGKFHVTRYFRWNGAGRLPTPPGQNAEAMDARESENRGDGGRCKLRTLSLSLLRICGVMFIAVEPHRSVD